MRLIDADKIDFGEVFKGASDFAKDTREAAQSVIDAQPTAFDIENVVDEIYKYIQMNKEKATKGQISYEELTDRVPCYECAIDIIKGRGIKK